MHDDVCTTHLFHRVSKLMLKQWCLQMVATKSTLSATETADAVPPANKATRINQMHSYTFAQMLYRYMKQPKYNQLIQVQHSHSET